MPAKYTEMGIRAKSITAAFEQGRRDCRARYSMSNSRYSDHEKDEAWLRGYRWEQEQKRKQVKR